MTPDQFRVLKEAVIAALDGPASARERTVRERLRSFPELVPEAERLLALDASDRDEVDSRSSAPEQIGPYHLEECIGRGGMGEVWRARQQEPIARWVALKLIRADLPREELTARFESERRMLARMNHPNVASVLDAGTTDRGQPFFVMEYVEGTPLSEFLAENPLSLPARLRLFIQICEGVAHAHQRAILHRDLKPANILVTVEHGSPLAKIIDFGVAVVLAGDARVDERLSLLHGRVLGTLEYASPEQLGGALDVDTRTDVYSLGVILYEILTGSVPIDADDAPDPSFESIRKHLLDGEPRRPSRHPVDPATPPASGRPEGSLSTPDRRALRGDLDWITMKALSLDREARYGSVEALRDDVERHLDDRPVAATRPTLGYRVRKFFRRHRVSATASIAVALSLVIGLGAALIGFSRARDAARAAHVEAQASNLMLDFLTRILDTADSEAARGNPITVARALRAASDGLLEATPSDDDATYVIRLHDGDVLELPSGVYATLLGRLAATQTRLSNPDMAARLLERVRHVEGEPEDIED